LQIQRGASARASFDGAFVEPPGKCWIKIVFRGICRASMTERRCGSCGKNVTWAGRLEAARPGIEPSDYWQRYMMPSWPLIALPGTQAMPLRVA
jgi:hypothetical protein